ncbi:nucleotidyltransferase family protein, partial [Ralstonia pseudosolanacearum]|uniref:nucleotidyltransferase family protein n=1 Tax=Ralstonia pseudosolanacearum TaxID=1310165 RepID=UPI003CEE3313
GPAHRIACRAAPTKKQLAASRARLLPLADMPWLAPHTIARVAQALDAHHCVAPFHQGRRGHPIGFGADYFAGLAALDGDEGARALIDPARLIRLDVGDAGTLRDVDTPADVCGA